MKNVHIAGMFAVFSPVLLAHITTAVWRVHSTGVWVSNLACGQSETIPIIILQLCGVSILLGSESRTLPEVDHYINQPILIH